MISLFISCTAHIEIMIELVHSIIRAFWEILVLIAMPWRAVIILIVLLPVFSWVFWRVIPWLLPKVSKIVFVFAELLVNVLLFFEYLFTKSLRKRGHKPPDLIYVFDDCFSKLVSFCQLVSKRLDKIFHNSLKKRWIPHKTWLILTGIIISFTWYARPVFGETGVGKFIDIGITWWYSFEGWVINKKWATSILKLSPQKTVIGYVNTINNQKYESAWNLTSNNFQNNKTLNKNGYDSYKKWWSTVKKIEIKSVKPLFKTPDYVLLDTQLKLFMKNGRRDSYSLKLGLVWDVKSNKWRIDSSE